MTWPCTCGGDMNVVDTRQEGQRYAYRRRACIHCNAHATTVEVRVEGTQPGRGHGVLAALRTLFARAPDPKHRVAPPQRRPA